MCLLYEQRYVLKRLNVRYTPVKLFRNCRGANGRFGRRYAYHTWYVTICRSTDLDIFSFVVTRGLRRRVYIQFKRVINSQFLITVRYRLTLGPKYRDRIAPRWRCRRIVNYMAGVVVNVHGESSRLQPSNS